MGKAKKTITADRADISVKKDLGSFDLSKLEIPDDMRSPDETNDADNQSALSQQAPDGAQTKNRGLAVFLQEGLENAKRKAQEKQNKNTSLSSVARAKTEKNNSPASAPLLPKGKKSERPSTQIKSGKSIPAFARASKKEAADTLRSPSRKAAKKSHLSEKNATHRKIADRNMSDASRQTTADAVLSGVEHETIALSDLSAAQHRVLAETETPNVAETTDESVKISEKENAPLPQTDRQKKSSHLLGVLLGYEKPHFSLKNSRLLRFFFDFSEFRLSGKTGALPVILKRSALRYFGTGITHILACTGANAYGCFWLAFGVLTLFLNFFAYYNSTGGDPPLAALIIGAAAVLLAIPFLFSSLPLSHYLQEHSLTDNLCFEILCFPRIRRADSDRVLPIWLMAAGGITLALFGFLFPIFRVLLIFGALMTAVLSAASPEFALLLTLFILPLLPLTDRGELILALMTGLSLLSYLTKSLLGKRVFHVSGYEILLFLMIPILLIAGTVHGNFHAAAIAAIPLLSYVLNNSMTANRRIADSAASVFLFSSVPTAGYGILRYFLDLLAGVRTEQYADAFFLPAFGKATGYLRASSTFKNPDIFACYLLAALVFSLAYTFDRTRSRGGRVCTALVFTIDLVALLLTYSHAAWAAMLITCAALPILLSKRTNRLFAIPLALLPAVPFFLPQNFRAHILSAIGLSDAPIAARVAATKEAFSEMPGNLLFGIGDSAFLADNGSIVGAFSPLAVRLLLTVGIPVTVLFFLLLLYRTEHLTKFARCFTDSSMKTPGFASAVTLFCWVCFGSAVSLFLDCTILYLFCVVCGIGSASLRISRTETIEREFYRAENADDAAATDIFVK